jgi:hypothetical protein
VCASPWYRIELAVSLAKADASPKVQTSVTEALHFRRADRFAADILWAAPDEVWRLLARKGYAEEIADGGAHTKFFTGGAFTTDFLRWMVRDEQRITLEEAHCRTVLRSRPPANFSPNAENQPLANFLRAI